MKITRIARFMVLIGYFGLLNLLMLWNTVVSPSHYFPVALVLIVLVVPLLCLLRGLLYARPSTHIVASYMSLFYMALAISEIAVNPAERWLAGLEIMLCLLLYSGALLYVRTYKSG